MDFAHRFCCLMVMVKCVTLESYTFNHYHEMLISTPPKRRFSPCYIKQRPFHKQALTRKHLVKSK
jgi:hypothetical protein